ncbi:MAG: hypothetical protein V4649_08245 [Bacteroidota bacterium]
MYVTYHFSSADEISTDMLDAIKMAFKDKPLVITVEEETDETAFLLRDPVNREMLRKSIAQEKNGEFVSVVIPND